MSDAGGGDGSGLECYDKVPSEHKTASAAKPNFTAIRAGIDVSWDQQLSLARGHGRIDGACWQPELSWRASEPARWDHLG